MGIYDQKDQLGQEIGGVEFERTSESLTKKKKLGVVQGGSASGVSSDAPVVPEGRPRENSVPQDRDRKRAPMNSTDKPSKNQSEAV